MADSREFFMALETIKVPRSPVDRRLLGTWKSDRRQTFKWFYPKPGCSPTNWRKFKAIFGKLIVRWGYTKCHTDLDGYKETRAYEVVASDANSVVVRILDPTAPRGRLCHIHFEGDYYWISVRNWREFFKRVQQ
jgi:hypothetical protein